MSFLKTIGLGWKLPHLASHSWRPTWCRLPDYCQDWRVPWQTWRHGSVSQANIVVVLFSCSFFIILFFVFLKKARDFIWSPPSEDKNERSFWSSFPKNKQKPCRINKKGNRNRMIHPKRTEIARSRSGPWIFETWIRKLQGPTAPIPQSQLGKSQGPGCKARARGRPSVLHLRGVGQNHRGDRGAPEQLSCTVSKDEEAQSETPQKQETTEKDTY